MKIILPIILILSMTGCTSITSLFLITDNTKPPTREDTKLIRSVEYQMEIDELLAEDAENKKWEKIYLKEIAAAQTHQDWDAYQYFLREYIAIPRFKLPEWIKKEPGYVEGINDEFIESLILIMKDNDSQLIFEAYTGEVLLPESEDPEGLPPLPPKPPSPPSGLFKDWTPSERLQYIAYEQALIKQLDFYLTNKDGSLSVFDMIKGKLTRARMQRSLQTSVEHHHKLTQEGR